MLKSLVPNFEACLLAGHCSHHCTFRACGNCPANVTACDAPQCVVANGYEKSIRTINRMVPGPSIQVRKRVPHFSERLMQYFNLSHNFLFSCSSMATVLNLAAILVFFLSEQRFLLAKLSTLSQSSVNKLRV